MNLEQLFDITKNMPVFDTETLLTGVPNPTSIRVQIARWVKSGKLIQLKRGVYLIPEKYRKVDIYEPYVASILKKPSYITMEKALEYYDIIPEAVTVYTSVTTKRPWTFSSQLGKFEYRHIRKSLFWGYKPITVNKQTAFIATPEKALLDLFYMNDIQVTEDYLVGLRLQNTKQLSGTRLISFARKFNKPKMIKAAKTLKDFIIKIEKEAKRL